jgi:hypothetical protein
LDVALTQMVVPAAWVARAEPEPVAALETAVVVGTAAVTTVAVEAAPARLP